MAKKKDVAGDGAYVNERVRIVYGELVESLAHVVVLAEQSSELLRRRVAELKSECANMSAERLLEEFAVTQATLEIQHVSYEYVKQSLYKATQGLGLLNIVGEQAISEHASKRAFNGHAATRDAKRTVFDWCDKHHHEYPRNMDGMAKAITEHKPPLVSQKWDAVRGWIAEWKKDRQLGAASKPDSHS
jgi:hypothetical protein